jgi:hypothetical protein
MKVSPHPSLRALQSKARLLGLLRLQGPVAQSGERRPRMAEVTSSSLVGSTPKRFCFAGKMQRANNGFQRNPTSAQRPCSNPRKCLHLQALCTHQRRPATYHASFTGQRLLVRSQHRPLLKPHFAGKTQVQGGDRDLHSTYLHQSDNRGPYVGWRRAGARSGGWAGALRAGCFRIGRVTGSSGARVMVAPWCATSSGAPWSKV